MRLILGLKDMGEDQQLVNLGLTKTVLLCIALEYYAIWVSWMLLLFRAISGFTNRLISW